MYSTSLYLDYYTCSMQGLFFKTKRGRLGEQFDITHTVQHNTLQLLVS